MSRQTAFDFDVLRLQGLRAAPSQVWGSVRLVPLIRDEALDDLRLTVQRYDTAPTVVDLGGRPGGPRRAYFGFVPHGLVVEWTDDGTPVAQSGTLLVTPKGQPVGRGCRVKLMHRMVKRQHGENRLRLLPLHLAMEGFLALHFGGPDVAWPAYAERALADGLSPRVEWSASGRSLAGFEDALRVFEVHDGQCGVLVYVADGLASAMVVPHPADYRALHHALIEDFYGELLWYYAAQHRVGDEPALRLDASGVETIDDLRRALAAARATWIEGFQQAAGAGLLERPVRARVLYRAGHYTLSRFLTGLDPTEENHLGEAIHGPDGALAYLKTYRLSRDQCERGHLLSTLAGHQWHPGRAAAALGQTEDALLARLEHAGLGYILAARRR